MSSRSLAGRNVLKSIIIDLEPLYSHAAGDSEYISIKLKSGPGRVLSNLITNLVSIVPKLPGIYVWGHFDCAGDWKYDYVGKSWSGITSHLYARLLEEIKEERGFLWCGSRIGVTESMLIERHLQNHPERPGKNFSVNHITRAMRKRDATHIVVVAMEGMSNENIRALESNLIAMLKPRGNSQRGKQSPHHTELTDRVASILGQQVELIRPQSLAAQA